MFEPVVVPYGQNGILRRILEMKLFLHRSAAIRMGMACGILLAVSAVAANAEDFTKSFAVTGRANVRVETNDGGVRVTSGDAQQARCRAEYHGYQRRKTLRVDAHQHGDKVQLT